jgi:hypothetical protein
MLAQKLSEILLLMQNPIDTYFNPRTPLAIAERFRKDGAKVLREALSTWKPWIPPVELVFASCSTLTSEELQMAVPCKKRPHNLAFADRCTVFVAMNI